MAIDFNTIDKIHRGEQAEVDDKASSVAERKLDEMINSMHEQTNAEHAQAVGQPQQQQGAVPDDELTAQAKQVLETMKDPSELEQLPPELQQRVQELLHQEIPDDHPDLQNQDVDPNGEQGEVAPDGDEQPMFNR